MPVALNYCKHNLMERLFLHLSVLLWTDKHFMFSQKVADIYLEVD